MKTYHFLFTDIGYEVKADSKEEAERRAEEELGKICYGLGGWAKLVREDD
jgi:hypothetical protein